MLLTPVSRAVTKKIFLFGLLAVLSVGQAFAFLAPGITSFSPASGPVGTLVTISGTNLASPSALTIGGQPAIVVSNTGSVLVAMVMPHAATGTISVTTVDGTAIGAGNFTVPATAYVNGQQGAGLTGTGSSGAARQGWAVSVSADGTTAIVSAPQDNGAVGAVWFYTRSAGSWTQQGTKQLGSGAGGAAQFGYSVSISADGNTAVVGGVVDNSNAGAVWFYTRSAGTWSQQGVKKVGSGAIGGAQQGISVSISADGNTALVGGYLDNTNRGAVWVYTRSAGTWNQQGTKLLATDFAGGSSRAGFSVSLSADGNTALVGGPADNGNIGAAWVYTRSAGVWTQQGTKLVGTGSTSNVQQGYSVALSADGNTALVAGPGDSMGAGAVWVYTRSGGTWSQQGSKLVGTGSIGNAQQGYSLALSADGNTMIVGGHLDNLGAGASWVYSRSGGIWTQDFKLIGTGTTGASRQGYSVSMSADGHTALIGGYQDNFAQGALWTFTVVPPPVITSFTPASGPVGTLVTISGTHLADPTALTIGGQTAIVISNTGSVLVAMVMPSATTGSLSVTTGGGTASGGSIFTVTPTPYPYSQQGAKLLGIGNTGAAGQGRSVSVSADGNTAIVGGFSDNGNVGAAWFYTRSGGIWSQQGPKRVATDGSGISQQGRSVSLSADGNTALVGGNTDNNSQGAAWVYTRSGGTWTQQGPKLIGTLNVGAAQQGFAVSLSADGNTAAVGGYTDNVSLGAVWMYVRSGGSWSQQGPKLIGSGANGGAGQGNSVSLSADGNTVLLGGHLDNGGAGAAWVYTRSAGVWTQQGTKLLATGSTGAAGLGRAASLSADGNTAMVGGHTDAGSVGAAWVYTRSGGTWTQQGLKLVGTGSSGASGQGQSVSLSADGTTAVVGGFNDTGGAGAAWVYTRSGGTWTQQGAKLVGTGTTGLAAQGFSVSVSADAYTAVIGGAGDNSGNGAAWAYAAGPYMQATYVTFSNTTTTTTSIGWTNGNGVARAVFMSLAISGGPVPANGTTYTAGTAYGTGTPIGATGWYCVYIGTGTSVDITGLTAGTTYRVMAVEYNGTATNEKYLTTAATGNPASVTTAYLGITPQGNATTGTTFVNANGRISAVATLSKYGQIIPCPTSLTITHTMGTVAPATVTITYGLVQTNLSGVNKCWITRNLGATAQATSTTDASDAAAGWYWQFNRMRGYSSTDGAASVPAWSATAISENSDWLAANDPCTQQLGAGWRIPTQTEWTSVSAGLAAAFANAYDSTLKMHAAGYMSGGSVSGRGTLGYYWFGTQSSAVNGWSATNTGVSSTMAKVTGMPLRCLKD